jgi:hypothetical protein
MGENNSHHVISYNKCGIGKYMPFYSDDNWSRPSLICRGYSK